jgi:hypothetical protein
VQETSQIYDDNPITYGMAAAERVRHIVQNIESIEQDDFCIATVDARLPIKTSDSEPEYFIVKYTG